MRAMARKDDGNAALVEIKAVDGAYPLYGAVKLEPAMPVADALAAERTAASAPPPMRRCWRGSTSRPAQCSASATPSFEVRAALATEPDKLAGGIGFGPRLLISEAGLRATNLAAAWQPRALALSIAAAR